MVWLGAWKPPGRMQQDAPLPLSQDPCPNKLGAGTFCPARGRGRTNGRLCKTSPCFLPGSLFSEQRETHPHFFHLFCQTTCAEPQLMQCNSHSFCNAELSSLTKNPLHRTRGLAWAFGLSVAELQKAPCRGHAPPALPASPGSLLSPVPRSRQQRRAEHVLQYQFIACYYFPAFGGSWHLPALFSCQLDKD